MKSNNLLMVGKGKHFTSFGIHAVFLNLVQHPKFISKLVFVVGDFWSHLFYVLKELFIQWFS